MTARPSLYGPVPQKAKDKAPCIECKEATHEEDRICSSLCRWAVGARQKVESGVGV